MPTRFSFPHAILMRFNLRRILRDRNGLNFPTDGINVSTVGPVEQLKRLREEHLKIQFTLSLHATDQATRNMIIITRNKGIFSARSQKELDS